MTEPIFTFDTTMDKKDYKKFLYTATFRRNIFMIPIIALITLVGAGLIVMDLDVFSLSSLLLWWVFMFVLAIGVICFKVERTNNQRIKTDKTGTFGSKTTLSFYDDKITFEVPSLKSNGTLEYTQLHKLMESKDFFMFYINHNQATLLRKQDMINIEKFREFIIPKFEGKYRCICKVK